MQPPSHDRTHLRRRRRASADGRREKGVTLSQLALAWCMHQPGVTSPIIGPRTMEQLEDNLGALDVDNGRRSRSDQPHHPPRRCVAPFYEAEFGPHPYRV